MSMVKCAECGFLCIRRDRDGEYLLAEDLMRRSGEFPFSPQPGEYEAFPICFRSVVSFQEQLGPNHPSPVSTMMELNRERSCDKFFERQLGYTPQQHAEMQKEIEMREWQAQQDSLNHKRHMQSLLVALLGTAIGAGATLLAVKMSPAPTINVVGPPSNTLTAPVTTSQK